MAQKVVPMFHVPDVAAAIEWYTSIGFTLGLSNEEDGQVNWASLSYQGSEIMLNAGGKPGSAGRREVDLYIHTDNVDDLFERLKSQGPVVEGPHDTFYGMREFIIRDINGFWLTFGQSARA
jgi:uncharacterized glyoxalase superfamily protein PhnB